MDGIELKKRILIKRPGYAFARKKIIDLFSNKQKSKGNFTEFGYIYRIYIYAFFVGYHRKERLPLPKKDKSTFLEMGKWQPSSLVSYMLMILICDEGLDKSWNELEDLKEKEVDWIIKKIVLLMEEYANAGLVYLEKKFDNEREEFGDPFVFANVLKECSQ
jgi:hypothetical protein